LIDLMIVMMTTIDLMALLIDLIFLSYEALVNRLTLSGGMAGRSRLASVGAVRGTYTRTNLGAAGRVFSDEPAGDN